MSVRLARSTDKVLEEERTAARCTGGPWAGRVVQLAPPDTVRNYEDIAWFPGLEAPIGTTFAPAICSTPGRRDVHFLVGASGSGKTTMARTIADEFLRTHPGCPVWVVCPDDANEDPALTGLAFTWLSPEAVRDNGVSLSDLADGCPRFLVILDDTEAAMDKSLAVAVDNLAHVLLERGRKAGAHVVYIAHRGAAGKASKVILAEMTSVWLPIEAAASANTSYMLEKHCNLPPDLRIALKKSAHEFGRWALFQLDGATRYGVTPKKVFVIDEDEVRGALSAAKKRVT